VQHQEKIQLAQNVRSSLPTVEKVGNFSHVTIYEKDKNVYNVFKMKAIIIQNYQSTSCYAPKVVSYPLDVCSVHGSSEPWQHSTH